ncbi:CRISPR-associated endoribonuclease Cas2 [Planctomycetales bacterium 10988]|nr:CRISPR-associated endoribonuclease Cas2 [Planctomycetales bacterium 10988]
MPKIYLVCYDVSDPKRLRKIYRTMKGFGDPLQYSIFRCELSARQRQAMRQMLWEILNFAEDRVMIVDLGPTEGRGNQCLEMWGEPRTEPTTRRAVVV